MPLPRLSRRPRPGRPTLAALLVLGLAGCAPGASPPGEAPQIDDAETPRSIILLMADGAGLAHWTLASFADEALAVRSMRSVGLVDTRGAEHTVSGSAPTATAYAIGVRSRMGHVGVDAEGRPMESVLEAARARGRSTGLVTTTGIVDATPAAFGAHNTARYNYGPIAREMATKGITVLLGGGRAAFRPEAQADSADLLAQVRREHIYVESIAELRALDPDTVDTLVGLLAEGEMGIVSERGDDALRTMTSTALDILSRNPAGFFLLIENEESDTQSHRNAAEEIVTAEMLDFDAAVRLALAYRAEHPETLVLVTSDHETGGLSLPHDPDREIVIEYSTGSHTGALVPLFAAGPGAERFGGIIRNDEVGRILLEMARR
ncbi:MAG TPA: alkaline phosphatase [Longimicrobiales bacterium]|nr:alkaline phosphatase [Longimicrobiales bacterium]